MKCYLVFRGMGTVGRVLAGLLRDAAEGLESRYGIILIPLLVTDSRGSADLGGSWSALDDAVRIKREGGALPGGVIGMEEIVGIKDSLGLSKGNGSRRLMVLDATPSDYSEPEPGISAMEGFLSMGVDVVTACKSPLATAWDRLGAARVEGRSRIGFTAATGLTSPGAGHMVRAFAGARFLGMEAVANGTSAYILGSMENSGSSFQEALAKAQEQGIAEPDPGLDVDGWDTAAKLAILHSALTGRGVGVSEVSRKGIRDVTPGEILAAKEKGGSIKLLAGSDSSGLSVAPVSLEMSHPLASLRGTEKGFVFETDLHGAICIRGGKSGVGTTASVMLSDILDLLLFH